MKKITEALRKKQITSKALPQDLQDQIAKLREEILAYNAAVEEYEKEKGEDNEDADEEADKKFEDLADSIAEKEVEIATAIENFQEAAKSDEPAPAPAAAPKKEDNSVGWLVFGGVVLALTLGAVNLMKKK